MWRVEGWGRRFWGGWGSLVDGMDGLARLMEDGCLDIGRGENGRAEEGCVSACLGQGRHGQMKLLPCES